MAEKLPCKNGTLKVGILAIQGAFSEHKTCLLKAKEQMLKDFKDFELDIVEVRCADHLKDLIGLIIPGGESTVMGKSLDKNGFGSAIKTWMDDARKPVVWGTCAGMILLAKDLQRMKTGGQSHVRNVYLIFALFHQFNNSSSF